MKTNGFYHIQIAVSDLERSLAFYTGLLGMEIAFREGDHLVFLRTPGAPDLLTLNSDADRGGTAISGLQHFGFSLPRDQHEQAVAEAKAFGAEVLSTGRRGGDDGEPYVYLNDPDGYTIELS